METKKRKIDGDENDKVIIIVDNKRYYFSKQRILNNGFENSYLNLLITTKNYVERNSEDHILLNVPNDLFHHIYNFVEYDILPNDNEITTNLTNLLDYFGLHDQFSELIYKRSIHKPSNSLSIKMQKQVCGKEMSLIGTTAEFHTGMSKIEEIENITKVNNLFTSYFHNLIKNIPNIIVSILLQNNDVFCFEINSIILKYSLNSKASGIKIKIPTYDGKFDESQMYCIHRKEFLSPTKISYFFDNKFQQYSGDVFFAEWVDDLLCFDKNNICLFLISQKRLSLKSIPNCEKLLYNYMQIKTIEVLIKKK